MANPNPASTPTDSLSHWLALYHAPGVGAASFQRVLEALPGHDLATPLDADSLQALGIDGTILQALRQTDHAAVCRDLEWQQQPGNHIMTCRDADYPLLLAQLSHPPPLLYLHGNTRLLGAPQLAMVGSRNPTPAGERIAAEFAASLADAGLVITSGLALGIDAASHRGALQAGAPTIAVMGTGLDRVYPASHRDLAREIATQGLLVSEFPVGTGPRPDHFPRRNRLISGLSLGTLVVEATPRSGSLITARLAGEQGREVFAIPGSINNPQARGCHQLIRQGAKLVETARDILEELGPLAGSCLSAEFTGTGQPAASESDSLGPDYQQLIDLIGFENTTVDQLVDSSGLTPAEVSSMLLQLELRGYLASGPGGIYNRLK